MSSNTSDGKCPVMHGSLTSNSSSGTSNKDWWPNQLNLSILHQHDRKGDPFDESFDYSEIFLEALNLKRRNGVAKGT